jgi:hypothetical protein
VSQSGQGQKIVVIQGGNIKSETSVIQPSTPSLGGSIVTSAVSAPSTPHDLGVKSIFPAPGTSGVSFTVKKEEQP